MKKAKLLIFSSLAIVAPIATIACSTNTNNTPVDKTPTNPIGPVDSKPGVQHKTTITYVFNGKKLNSWTGNDVTYAKIEEKAPKIIINDEGQEIKIMIKNPNLTIKQNENNIVEMISSTVLNTTNIIFKNPDGNIKPISVNITTSNDSKITLEQLLKEIPNGYVLENPEVINNIVIGKQIIINIVKETKNGAPNSTAQLFKEFQVKYKKFSSLKDDLINKNREVFSPIDKNVNLNTNNLNEQTLTTNLAQLDSIIPNLESILNKYNELNPGNLSSQDWLYQFRHKNFAELLKKSLLQMGEDAIKRNGIEHKKSLIETYNSDVDELVTKYNDHDFEKILNDTNLTYQQVKNELFKIIKVRNNYIYKNDKINEININLEKETSKIEKIKYLLNFLKENFDNFIDKEQLPIDRNTYINVKSIYEKYTQQISSITIENDSTTNELQTILNDLYKSCVDLLSEIALTFTKWTQNRITVEPQLIALYSTLKYLEGQHWNSQIYSNLYKWVISVSPQLKDPYDSILDLFKINKDLSIDEQIKQIYKKLNQPQPDDKTPIGVQAEITFKWAKNVEILINQVPQLVNQLLEETLESLNLLKARLETNVINKETSIAKANSILAKFTSLMNSKEDVYNVNELLDIRSEAQNFLNNNANYF
ncbi:hypothetical protein GE118_00085 [Mycoplasma sp. NEAQ87857]|uniref:hypothetical protein n=1 Tax=Mycoplasma sp. NEAQ87857 TaxID=2683967 RepID=UPI001316F7E5|nr:hypothetical protein [Mycoplasma sp. NEAQ87857]QGZ97201.1 hypothetical protein GE118_00085 [Mycoplasma sp. NEAQ87857]